MSLTRFEKVVNRNTKDEEKDFRQYLNRLMYEKDVTQATISRRSLIKGPILSRYTNGSGEIPTKMVFRIALYLKLNLIETETLLRKVGKGIMETKLDAVVIEAIDRRIYDVIKVEAVLRKYTNGEKSIFQRKSKKSLV